MALGPTTKINLGIQTQEENESEAINVTCVNCNQEITVLRKIINDRDGLCFICYNNRGVRGVISNV